MAILCGMPTIQYIRLEVFGYLCTICLLPTFYEAYIVT